MAVAMLMASLGVQAQGNNSGMGGEQDNYKSLAERVLNLEKSNNKFNVYFNYTAAAQASDEQGPWQSRIAAKELRFEIMGHLTDRISYRFRHRLNKSNAAMSGDNFAKATDMMFVGYKINDQVEVAGGKVSQVWGGFEYDENPMFIYQYSDFCEYLEIFFGGAYVTYKPVPSQEFVLEVTHTDNGSMNDYYGCKPVAVSEKHETKQLEQSRHPFTYIFNWNGNFVGNKLQTRWSAGLQTQARGTYSKVLMCGQQLNLPRLQWYFDYMERWDDVDRLGYPSKELHAGNMLHLCADEPASIGDASDDTGKYFTDTHFRSLVTKARWTLSPKWKLMLKGMYDIASVRKVEEYKNYRKALGFIGSLEFYPDRTQDFRLYLAYLGRHYDYSKRCGLPERNTTRIELGMMYRMKCY